VKIIESSRDKLVLKASPKDETFGENGAFVFDIGIIPDKPTPKILVIQKRSGKQSWTITWKNFLRQKCVGDVVILRKSELTYSTNPI
jgi:hypothetical protein